MADPISLAAVAGLIFAGRALSNKSEPPKVVQWKPEEQQILREREPEFEEPIFESRVEVPRKLKRLGDFKHGGLCTRIHEICPRGIGTPVTS